LTDLYYISPAAWKQDRSATIWWKGGQYFLCRCHWSRFFSVLTNSYCWSSFRQVTQMNYSN